MNPSNQERWDKLVSMITDETRKKQFDKFIEYAKEHSSYFTAPASPAYHCSWEEGLVEHSMNVATNAVILNRALKANLNEEELIIGGLVHDFGKCYIGEDEPYYTISVPTPAQAKAGYVPYPAYGYNKEGQVFMTVPQRAVRILTQFVDISDALYQAILIHDGQYVQENKPYGAKENPMALILHYADSWAGFTMEGKTEKSPSGKSYVKVEEDKVGNHGFDIRVSQVVESQNRWR